MSETELINQCNLICDCIIKETGRKDLKVEYFKREGWRLTGEYPDGTRSSVGGLGVIPKIKQFYDRLYGFWMGACSMKAWSGQEVESTVRKAA